MFRREIEYACAVYEWSPCRGNNIICLFACCCLFSGCRVHIEWDCSSAFAACTPNGTGNDTHTHSPLDAYTQRAALVKYVRARSRCSQRCATIAAGIYSRSNKMCWKGILFYCTYLRYFCSHSISRMRLAHTRLAHTRRHSMRHSAHGTHTHCFREFATFRCTYIDIREFADIMIFHSDSFHLNRHTRKKRRKKKPIHIRCVTLWRSRRRFLPHSRQHHATVARLSAGENLARKILCCFFFFAFTSSFSLFSQWPSVAISSFARVGRRSTSYIIRFVYFSTDALQSTIKTM